jgi:transcriptional regulator with XRE-family HTH domain
MTALQLLGAAIRAHRQRLGLTQHELAARTGFHYSYIGDVERGHRNVTIHTLLRLARGLGVRPSQLLERLDTMPDLDAPNARSDSP